jgi:O-antigen/teichoic acid export membrane protein
VKGEPGLGGAPPLVANDDAERTRTLRLAEKARNGTHAMLATRVLAIVSTLASITIVSRLVPPADFGVYALAWLALGLVSLLREFGIGSAIVQARDLSAQQQNKYFWVSLALALAASASLATAAPLLADVYDEPILGSVVWVFAIAPVLNAIAFVHLALLRRHLEYNKLAFIEAGAILCALTTALTAAYFWRDVWALVAADLVKWLWTGATAWLLCRWVPGKPSRTGASINLAFGFQVALYNVLTYAGNNIGLAAGYRFSSTDLGFFNRGRTLCQVAQYAFLTPITEVGLSLLCRLRSEAAYRDAYMGLARRVALLFIPLSAVLPIVSDDLVLALLGPAWTPAAPIVAWFAPVILGQAFAAVFAQLMTSQGRGRELRRWAAVDLILRAAGAVAGSQYGVVGLAAGFSLATILLTVPLMLWIAGRSGPVKLADQLVAAWPGTLLAAVAAAAAGLAVLAADAQGLSAGWSRLVFVGGSAVLAWAAVCLLVAPARHSILGKGLARA